MKLAVNNWHLHGCDWSPMSWVNPRIVWGWGKNPPAQFWNHKKIRFTVGPGRFLIFLNMDWVQNATVRSPIGVLEVANVKHVRNFWYWRNLMLILNTMAKRIQN